MYFKLVAVVNVETDAGHKPTKFAYLTDAVSYTDAEARLYQIAKEKEWPSEAWEVDTISRANYDIVLPLKDADEDEPEHFYAIKYSLDLGTGSKPVKPDLCVQAASDEQARQIGLKHYEDYNPRQVEFLKMALTDIREYVTFNSENEEENE